MLAQGPVCLAGLSGHGAVGSFIPGLAGAVEPSPALIFYTGATRQAETRGSLTRRNSLLAECTSVTFRALALIVIMTKARTLIPLFIFPVLPVQTSCPIPAPVPHTVICAHLTQPSLPARHTATPTTHSIRHNHHILALPQLSCCWHGASPTIPAWVVKANINHILQNE